MDVGCWKIKQNKRKKAKMQNKLICILNAQN